MIIVIYARDEKVVISHTVVAQEHTAIMGIINEYFQLIIDNIGVGSTTEKHSINEERN